MNASRAYARASQETASRERLMVMLFEAALRHMRHAATLLEQQKVIDALPLMTKASDIVVELADTLDPQAAPELTRTLGEIYVFVSQRLARAASFRDVTALREAERAFAPIVEAFQQAVASLGAPAAP
ncbi:MAG: flagellar export chaperone FliS [Archangium sp.]|nr:flagellar export chaperone FliS [Archangium sp.]